MNGFEWLIVLTPDWQRLSVRLSLTLMHFLWQGVAVGTVLAFAFRLLRTSSANSRYLVACAALGCLPIVALLTFSIVNVPDDFPGNMGRAGFAPMFAAAHDDLAATADTSEIKNDDAGSVESSIASEVSPPTTANTKLANAQPRTPSGEKTSLVGSLSSLYRLLPWLAGLYVCGVILMLMRLLLTVWRGSRLRSGATQVTEPDLLMLVARLAKQMELRIAPAVYYCERIAVPAVLGVWKPAILLPASLVTNLSASEIDAILSHELAHIRRFDPVIQFLQRAIESVLFFHPVVWWVSRQMSNERENCCDDLVAASGFGNVGYAAALLRIAELCAPNRGPKFAGQIATLSIKGTHTNQLSRRIERLLNMHTLPRLAPSRLFSFGATLTLMLAVVSVSVLASVTKHQPAITVERISPPENPMAKTISRPDNDSQLKTAIDNFNKDNRELGRGLDQPPLTEEEVLTAIRNCEWKRDAPKMNEPEVAALKAVAENRSLPPDAYFYVYTSQQTETFTVRHFWRIQLFLPAIGHDGFVGFTIRDTKFADEIIDPKSVAWGEPDADGLSLGCYLSPKKETYQIGDRVRLRLFVRHQGTQPVESTWANTTHPAPGNFTVVDETGHAVAVNYGHDDWFIPWISGYLGGSIDPGFTHYFHVPYEIRIGGADAADANRLIGRIIAAQPGQTLKLKVSASNGSNRSRIKGGPLPETGVISFSVENAPAATPAKAQRDEPKIPLEQVVWWDAGDGLEAGFLLTSPEPPNQRIPWNSVAKFQVLVRNKSDQEVRFLARLIPHEMADASFLIPSDDINGALAAAQLPAKYRATGGESHVLEPAYIIKLAPAESAIVRSQRAKDDLGLYIGDAEQKEYPQVAAIMPGMNWIVQPLQLHIPQPMGGTELLGIAYTLTKVDRDGNTRQEIANRMVAVPGGKIVYPRMQLEIGNLNAAAEQNAQSAAWGKVDKGLQCGIRLLNRKPSYGIGDTLEAELIWRNVSDKDIMTPIPRKHDLYPIVRDAEGRERMIDFGARMMLRPGSVWFKSGEIHSLGVTSIRLVAEGTALPESNLEPGHLTLEPGVYLLCGLGGVSGPDTGNPKSGDIEFLVSNE